LKTTEPASKINCSSSRFD